MYFLFVCVLLYFFFLGGGYFYGGGGVIRGVFWGFLGGFVCFLFFAIFILSLFFHIHKYTCRHQWKNDALTLIYVSGHGEKLSM